MSMSNSCISRFFARPRLNDPTTALLSTLNQDLGPP